jgi:putative membrane protein
VQYDCHLGVGAGRSILNALTALRAARPKTIESLKRLMVSNGRRGVRAVTRKRQFGSRTRLAGQLQLTRMMDSPTRARDHLANERTFLAWLRTGLAVVAFGFAIGRFAIAIQEFMKVEGHPQSAARLSVWFGLMAIVTGIVLVFAALKRYRRTRAQLEAGEFEPAGLLIEVVAILAVVRGLALAGYLVYIRPLH